MQCLKLAIKIFMAFARYLFGASPDACLVYKRAGSVGNKKGVGLMLGFIMFSDHFHYALLCILSANYGGSSSPYYYSRDDVPALMTRVTSGALASLMHSQGRN